ncbi:MAG: aminoglycoside phosphotransferase family protein [Polyangiaceae bacterium]
MTTHAMTPELACKKLSEAGFTLLPSDVTIEPRDDRWLVRIPGRRVAWFAANDAGAQRMTTERRVLRLLQTRCAFEVPRVLFENALGSFDVRTMVGSDVDPREIDTRACEDVEFARATGKALGTILADQHSHIGLPDVANWLPLRPSWPKPRDWIGEQLQAVTNDRELLKRADIVMKIYEELRIQEADCALVHTDVGMHNLALDQARVVRGLFDYEEAAWADRHHDFRYLVFDGDRGELLEGALSAYESVTGYAIQRDRVLLYNASCALTYLAYRAGTSPAERSYGRTLEEDLRWSKSAIERVLAG